MWYVWTVKGQPPWAWNADREVYLEDIQAVKKMDEFHADRQSMKNKSKGKGKGRRR
jgi:hypothetical protein